VGEVVGGVVGGVVGEVVEPIVVVGGEYPPELGSFGSWYPGGATVGVKLHQ
jgi:hypothetical protein